MGKLEEYGAEKKMEGILLAGIRMLQTGLKIDYVADTLQLTSEQIEMLKEDARKNGLLTTQAFI